MPKQYQQYDDLETYTEYEEMFDPKQVDRQARRKRKPRKNPKQEVDYTEFADDIADTIDLYQGFDITYKPSLHESGWLIDSLRTFFETDYITDVLALVKGGKEASVYRCATHPETTEGAAFVAAKVYRPRMFRNLRNDKMYRQGRTVLSIDGKEITEKNQREMRAMQKGSSLGQQMQHTSWLMYEYTTLQTLYDAGGDVPKPIANGLNAILMSYHGDEYMAAPTLNSVSLERDDAHRLFKRVMGNIELMLRHGVTHGDLSAYNILYWQGAITLIDFPQVADISGNDKARFILGRDIERVCDYFQKQGVKCDAQRLTDKLWHRYGHEAANPEEVMFNLEAMQALQEQEREAQTEGDD